MPSKTLSISAIASVLFAALGCAGAQSEGDNSSDTAGSAGSVPSGSKGGASSATGSSGRSGSGDTSGAGPSSGISGGFASGGSASGGAPQGGSANGSSSGGAHPGGSTSAGAGAPSAGAGAPSAGAGAPSAGAGGALPKFVGNITTGAGNGMDQGTRKFATYWDQVTPENAGKWGSVQSSVSSAFNWTALDAIYDYAEKNQIIFKQHNFIWGQQQPGGSVTPEAVQKWMTEFCKRYPNTKLIDVVNEPPPHTTPSYAGAIGGGTNGDWKWIANAFTWARAACPGAILILNDFNDIEWTNDNAHMIDIVKKIQAAGAPIDAIGAQAHDLDQGSVSLATVTKLMGQLNSETGLPIYITEMDISTTDDTQQLNLYKQYIPLFMNTSYVKGITIWGWVYGQTWSSAPNSGLIRNGSPRSAMTYLMEQLGRPAP